MNAAPDGSPVSAGQLEQRRATTATSMGEGLLPGVLRSAVERGPGGVFEERDR
jgi:hypothetical protein